MGQNPFGILGIFHRKQRGTRSQRKIIAVLTQAFIDAWKHITFHNWVAVGLTLVGGVQFGRSYSLTHALLFVACEHALYGCLVFTVGLGKYLLEGTLRLVQ